MSALPLPLVLLRKKRKADATVAEINDALDEASSSDETTAPRRLSKSYFLKRIVSSKKSLTVYVVLRDESTNERLSAAELGACCARLCVVLRTRAGAASAVRVRTSVVLDYVDSVVLFNAEFAPPLTAAFAVRCTLDGAPLRSASADAADIAEFVHELVRFDPHNRISPIKPPPTAHVMKKR